jgi:hypothetical protein
VRGLDAAGLVRDLEVPVDEPIALQVNPRFSAPERCTPSRRRCREAQMTHEQTNTELMHLVGMIQQVGIK